MENVVLWALSTGFVTGAVWVGIVLLRRRPGALHAGTESRERARHRLDQLEDARGRLGQLEERLDFAERAITARPPRDPAESLRKPPVR